MNAKGKTYPANYFCHQQHTIQPINRPKYLLHLQGKKSTDDTSKTQKMLNANTTRENCWENIRCWEPVTRPRHPIHKNIMERIRKSIDSLYNWIEWCKTAPTSQLSTGRHCHYQKAEGGFQNMDHQTKKKEEGAPKAKRQLPQYIHQINYKWTN